MISDAELAGFQKYSRRYGVSSDTAFKYAKEVRLCSLEEDLLDRLADDELSPKYLRLIRSSLKKWAQFSKDTELEDELKRIKLPPPHRQKEKTAIPRKKWQKLRQVVDSADFLGDFMRADLGILVNRGLRSADVLRIERSQVKHALRSGILSFKAKGRRQLEFPVGERWRPYLEIFAREKSWERVSDLISPGAKPASAAKAVSRSLELCRLEAKLPELHPHLLRHTYATYYYQECRDPNKLRQHMGWAKIETAMAYVTADDARELDAIAEGMFS